LRVTVVAASLLIIVWGGFSLLSGDQPTDNETLVEVQESTSGAPTPDAATAIGQEVRESEASLGAEAAAADAGQLIAGNVPNLAPGDGAVFDERATLERYPPLESASDTTLANDTMNPAVEVAPVEPLLSKLTVTPVPEDSLVRILNIGPRYAPGIELKPGPYHIEVSHNGYVTHTSWVTLTEEPLTTAITLEKAPELPRQFSADLGNGKRGPAMVTIDPGRFSMGSATDPKTMPVHRVTIPRPFAISQYEI